MTYSIEEARRLRAIIEHQMQTANEEIAIQAVSLYPMWKPGMDYSAGYRVQYKEVLYLVITDHKSQGSWTPDVSPSLFTEVLIPDENVIPEWKQPESTNPYKQGDVVTYNDKTWVSDVDNNVWTPGEYGWSEITE